MNKETDNDADVSNANMMNEDYSKMSSIEAKKRFKKTLNVSSYHASFGEPPKMAEDFMVLK